jgi:thiamine-phosphate pyrophosphorylase
MDAPEQPQIYLITPPEIALSRFPDVLARVLDAAEIACIRLALSSSDESEIMRAGDAVRAVAHARDVPLVIAEHVALAERLGLDGVHLSDGARSLRAARKLLGADAIVGAFCGVSRHDGMGAGEAGADYVAFGPVQAGSLGLGDGQSAAPELFAWWSEMIELPVVAEGGLDAASVAALAPVTDFFGIGPEIWSAEDPVAALVALRGAFTEKVG